MRMITALFCMLLLMPAVYAVSSPDNIITQRDDTIVQLSLNNTMKYADKDGKIKAWVFFTDKGFSTITDYSLKLDETENRLTERARSRRLKARGSNNLVDFRDIKVYQSYIDQVLAAGVKHRQVLRWFNAITIEANRRQLEQISQLPFVRMFKHVSTAVYPDNYFPKADGSIDYPITMSTLDYGFSGDQLNQINTIVAHELGFAGQDVLVCMMDVGFRQGHNVFQNIINDGRLIAQWDFINDDDNTDYEADQDVENQPNHGTLTWSTLGGEASGYLYGPAYEADFCLAKTEDVTSEHHIEEDNWAAGAEWADSLGASVISVSLGYRYNFDWPDEDYTYEDMDGNTTIVTIAADIAAGNGIAVATAQGNDGYFGDGSLIAPADGDSVIAVGAVDNQDWLASFSGLGPTYDDRIKPEVCALGVSTVCADPYDYSGYTWAGGTSLSTPLVGGAAAVLLSAHPNWTPMMVREALMMTATQYNNPDSWYGWGIIDVGKALFYHPEGDVVVEHEPLVYFPPGLDNNIIEATVTGDFNYNDVYLCWRTDDSMPFTATVMQTSDNQHYEGIVPGLDEGYLQYYFYILIANYNNATYPYGAPENFFNININTSEFVDSFELGPYYWKSSGDEQQWAITAEMSSSGNICMTDSPYRYYKNNTEQILTGNFGIPLHEADSAAVSFGASYVLQTNNDFVYFEISTDGGQQWEQLGEPITGVSFEFEEISHNLQGYLGNEVRFRFRMVTNGSGTREGIHIDDFHVVWANQTGIDDDISPMPYKFNLAQNYPNPFNASTRIKFSLNKTAYTQLTVYDILGRNVRTLLAKEMTAGDHEIIWDSRDNSGSDVASGIYMYKLESKNTSRVKRMTLLR
ncbi:MAG: S8 family serine peptidase [candidate division Zixibacteria bacterium]|nr:S8 family serine peptidase [candidate division Zixibacteria bacterium]